MSAFGLNLGVVKSIPLTSWAPALASRLMLGLFVNNLKMMIVMIPTLQINRRVRRRPWTGGPGYDLDNSTISFQRGPRGEFPLPNRPVCLQILYIMFFVMYVFWFGIKSSGLRSIRHVGLTFLLLEILEYHTNLGVVNFIPTTSRVSTFWVPISLCSGTKKE